jgi:hypothetical protein
LPKEGMEWDTVRSVGVGELGALMRAPD